MDLSFFQHELENLKSQRANFENLWTHVAEYVYPSRDNFTKKRTNGEELNDKIFDSTPCIAAQMLASGLHGMCSNPSTDWFAFDFKNDNREQQEKTDILSKWLEDVKDVVQYQINKPNTGFQSNIHELYLDLVLFGTGVIMETYDEQNESLMFQCIPLEQIFLVEDYKGAITRLYRVFEWTREQIVSVFGEEYLPQSLQSKKDDSCKYKIAHVVFDNKDNTQFAYKSIYFLVETGEEIKHSYYYEMPYLVARWIKSPQEVYGRSPAISALPDIRLLNELNKEALIAVQLANRPPVLVSDVDSHYPINIYPNSLIKYRSGQAPQPLNLAVQPAVAMQMITEIKERIRFAFYNDQLITQTNSSMTATEVNARVNERMRLLLPIFGRLQQDLLGPLVERSYKILERHGFIPPIPQEVNKGTLEIEYISLMALAQKSSQLSRYNDMLAYASSFIQLNPNIAQVIDGEVALRDIAESFNLGFVIKDHDVLEEQAQVEAQQQAETNYLTNEQMKANINNVNANTEVLMNQ